MNVIEMIRKRLEEQGFLYNIDFDENDLREMALEYIDTLYIKKDKDSVIESVIKNWIRRNT